jgi:hypothetical protein
VQQNPNYEGVGVGEVSEKSLENEAVSGFPSPGRGWAGPFWHAGVARDGKDEKTAPTEAIGRILLVDWKAKSWFRCSGAER